MRLFSALILISIGLLSCKKAEDRACAKSVGDSVTETREVGDFNELRLFDGMHCDLYQDSLDKVVIRCGENLIHFIDTEVEDGVLTITDGNKCSWLRKFPVDIRVEIHYTGLEHAYVESHGDIRMMTRHRGEFLQWASWHVNTKSELDVDVDVLVLTVNGGGTEMTVRGETSEVYYHHDGLGFIDGRGLNSQYYWANNLHEGLIRLGFPDGGGLQYIIDSYGDITYTGTPDTIEEIEHLGDGELKQE